MFSFMSVVGGNHRHGTRDAVGVGGWGRFAAGLRAPLPRERVAGGVLGLQVVRPGVGGVPELDYFLGFGEAGLEGKYDGCGLEDFMKLCFGL